MLVAAAEVEVAPFPYRALSLVLDGIPRIGQRVVVPSILPLVLWL